MLVKKIDLLVPAADKYELLHYFTLKLHEALLRLGVRSRLLESERLNPLPFLQQIFNDPPDCTLSFNGLLPDAEGRFFCDLIHIPHIAYLAGSPHHFFALTNTPYNVIACTEHLYSRIFKSMGHKGALFLPHGIDPNYHALSERPVADILFIDGNIDWELQEKAWEKKYPPLIYKAMLAAADETLAQRELSGIQALTGHLQAKTKDAKLFEKEEFNFSILLDELESYLQAKSTYYLAQAFKGHQCVVLGTKHTKSHWEKLIGDVPHIKFIEKKGLTTIMQWLGKTKIIVDGSLSIKDGTNDYLFLAMVSGSVVVTNYNRYLQEAFKEDEELFFFAPTQLEPLAEKITHVLQDDEKRQHIAARGRHKVMRHHTWDHRAATLLKEVGPLIAQLKQPQIT